MSKGSRNRTRDKRRFDDNFEEIRWPRKAPRNDIFNDWDYDDPDYHHEVRIRNGRNCNGNTNTSNRT